MSKQITFDEEALRKIQIGINKLADTVKLTLGPGGNCVVIEKQSYHQITKDGVTIAREISLEDPIENVGAHIIKEAAQKTVEGCGDGTTTSTVLAQAIFNAGLKNITAGAARMDLKRGIDLAVKTVVEQIAKLSVPVANGDLLKIATISANGDETIGKLIQEAIEKVGREGIVSVEDTKNLESFVTTVDGVRFDRGWLSGYFAAENLQQEWNHTDCQVLVYEGKISSFKELIPFLEKVRKVTTKPLLIICEDCDGDALATLAMNYIQKRMVVCVVSSPDMNEKRKEHMKDMAAVVGATIVARETGISLSTATEKVLGTADRIRVSQFSTLILGGGGKGLTINNRIATIDEEMKEANNQAIVALQYRKARLQSGIAVINVGGSTEVEIKEKKDRIDDSLNATRAALDEGVVPGGGVAYVRVVEEISLNDGWPTPENPDQLTGMKIIQSALMEPFRAIIENVGGSPDVVLNKVLTGENAYGYNAKTLQYCDLIESGIIDPAKVTRLALENAASVAAMLLTTKAIISTIKPSAK
jgi:chaperonin GroEL